ncbi:MAG: SRPBCC domain-containing protein [Acidobacteria bacterium]|nr:SRPBCC domain-containing protein [Acidobacteriota bacterium]
MSAEIMIEPVRSVVEVELEQKEAFEFFTSHLSRWWPLEAYSVSGKRTETAVFELAEGGEIFELAENSERITWGTVLLFEPPSRLIFSWHPGRDADTAQEVEVTFESTSSGTRVSLEHRGWEALGEDAQKIREPYVNGWAYVLGECYRKGAHHRD